MKSTAVLRTTLCSTLCATLLLLAGCASDGGLAPQARLGDARQLSMQFILPQDAGLTAAWPERGWWRRYGDRQLDDLVDEALAGSPGMRIAAARVRQAQAISAVAGAALSPQASAGAKSARQLYSANSTVPKPLAGNWAWSNEATLNFSYELDFWDKNDAALAAAIGRQHASVADAESARLVLVVGVIQSYLKLSQLYAQLDLAVAVLKQRRDVQDLTRQRVAAQIDSALELKQADMAIPVAREQIAAAHEAIALTRTQLAALLGAGPDRGAAIARPQLTVAQRAGLPSNLPSDLIGRRPDVVAQRWRVEALRKDIAVAKAQFYPSINLTALIGLQSLGFDKFLSSGSRVTGAGAAFNLPLFDGGRLRGNLALRDAEYDTAVESYNQAIVEAVRDIASQLVAMDWLAQRAALQNEAVDTARQAHQLSLQRYRSGLGNYLQVLATEAQVLAQQRAQIDLDTRAFELDMNLIRALGGDYVPAVLPTTVSTLSTGN